MVFSFLIMVTASAAFVTRALVSKILLDLSALRQSFAYITTAVHVYVRSCCISAIFFHFFYTNTVCFCFSKYHHWGEELLCIPNFQGQPIDICTPLKRLLFLESPVQNFLIPTANSLIIPGSLFCRLSLPINDDFNYFLMELKIPIFWNIIFNCCSFLILMWRW